MSANRKLSGFDAGIVMKARYTGEIPLDKVQEAFAKMELENMEVIGRKGPRRVKPSKNVTLGWVVGTFER